MTPETEPKPGQLKKLKYIPGHEVTGTIDELVSEVKGFKEVFGTFFEDSESIRVLVKP